MIFNINESNTSLDNVKDCPYELCEAGLMYVYENECNYTNLMKSVGIAELKYYNETGKELFLNESGAFSNFIDKVVEFFKKVVEKIRSIFKKFFETIKTHQVKNQLFLKKYEKKLADKDSVDEFEGYEFNMKNFGTYISNFSQSYEKKNKNIKKEAEFFDSVIKDTAETYSDLDSEKKLTVGAIINKEGLSIEEFTKAIKEEVYGGEKKKLTNIKIADCVDTIKSAPEIINTFNTSEKNVTSNINKFIKLLENLSKSYKKEANKESDESKKKSIETHIKNINAEIELYKVESQAATILCSTYATAELDKVNQAKAICIKALSGNKEEDKKDDSSNNSSDNKGDSNNNSGESKNESFDLFANVNII